MHWFSSQLSSKSAEISHFLATEKYPTSSALFTPSPVIWYSQRTAVSPSTQIFLAWPLNAFALYFTFKTERGFKRKYFSLERHQMLIKSLINSDSDGLTFFSLARNFNQVFFFWWCCFHAAFHCICDLSGIVLYGHIGRKGWDKRRLGWEKSLEQDVFSRLVFLFFLFQKQTQKVLLLLWVPQELFKLQTICLIVLNWS